MSMLLKPAVRVMTDWKKPASTRSAGWRPPRVAGLAHSTAVRNTVPPARRMAEPTRTSFVFMLQWIGRRYCRPSSKRTGNPSPPMITAAAIGRQIQGSPTNPIRLSEYRAKPALLKDEMEWNTPCQTASPSAIAVPGHEADRENQRQRCFHDHTDEQNADQHAADVTEPAAFGLGGGGYPGLQAQPAGGQDPEQRAEGHHAEAADLDQDQDDHLAESAPEDGCVHGDQAGDADGGGGGEQRLQQAGPAPACLGHREQQQPGPDGDGGGEAQHDHLGRVARRERPEEPGEARSQGAQNRGNFDLHRRHATTGRAAAADGDQPSRSCTSSRHFR